MCGNKLTPQSLRLPLKIVVGRLLSYWEVDFSRENSMLNFGRVNSRSQSHQFHPTLTHWHATTWFNKFSTVQPSEFFTAQQGQFQVPNTVRSWEPRESGWRSESFSTYRGERTLVTYLYWVISWNSIYNPKVPYGYMALLTDPWMVDFVWQINAKKIYIVPWIQWVMEYVPSLGKLLSQWFIGNNLICVG